MRITSFKKHNNMYSSGMENNLRKSRERNTVLKKDDYLKQYNTEYTTNRPAEAISFSGSVSSMAASLGDSIGSMNEKLGASIAESGAMNKLTRFVKNNEVAYSNINALILAGILKPYFVIKQKGGDKKDKVMIATKNSLQAFVGFFLSMTIGGGLVKKSVDIIKTNLELLSVDEDGTTLKTALPESKEAKNCAKDMLKREKTGFSAKFGLAKKAFSDESGLKKITNSVPLLFKKIKYTPQEDEILAKAKEVVDNLDKNHKKFFERDISFVKELKSRSCKNKTSLYDAFESLWKNSTNLITTLGKAKITSMLLPIVTTFLFVRFGLQEEAKKNNKENSTLVNSRAFQNDLKNFEKFSADSKEINFTGSLFDKGADKLASFVENIAMSKGGQNCAQALTKVKKPSSFLMHFESAGLTAYWVGSTTLSKKIDPDQKLGFNIHSVLVTLVSSTAAFIIDTLLDPIINYAEKGYKNKVTSVIENVKKQSEADKSLDVETLIKQNCSNLYNPADIAKKLIGKTGTLLESKELETEITNLAKDYNKTLSKLKSLTIFTLVVRFLVPVLTVNVSGKIKKMIVEKTKGNKNKKTDAA